VSGDSKKTGHKSSNPRDELELVCSDIRWSGLSMLTAADCKHRAEECRRLAKLAARPEDWGHFQEMAQTWELLAKQRQSDKQLADTWALADALANGREPIQKKAA
jgi:hypothetical protein